MENENISPNSASAEMPNQSLLDEIHRRTCREVAAHLIMAMAEEDISIAQLAAKVGSKERIVRSFLIGLIDGNSKALRPATDLAAALNRKFHLGLERMPEENRGKTEVFASDPDVDPL